MPAEITSAGCRKKCFDSVQQNISDDFSFAVTGIGADANRPPCKKAKLARLERKHQKLLNQGLSQEEADSLLKQTRLQKQEGKSLEDLLNEPLPTNPAHRLRVIISLVLILRKAYKSYVQYFAIEQHT